MKIIFVLLCPDDLFNLFAAFFQFWLAFGYGTASLCTSGKGPNLGIFPSYGSPHLPIPHYLEVLRTMSRGEGFRTNCHLLPLACMEMLLGMQEELRMAPFLMWLHATLLPFPHSTFFDGVICRQCPVFLLVLLRTVGGGGERGVWVPKELFLSEAWLFCKFSRNYTACISVVYIDDQNVKSLEQFLC